MTHRLTPTKLDFLRAVADGGVTVQEFSIRDGRRVHGNGTVKFNIRTYDALAAARLVTCDTSTSLFHGQAVQLTSDGKKALADHNTPPEKVTAGPTTMVSAQPLEGRVGKYDPKWITFETNDRDGSLAVRTLTKRIDIKDPVRAQEIIRLLMELTGMDA